MLKLLLLYYNWCYIKKRSKSVKNLFPNILFPTCGENPDCYYAVCFTSANSVQGADPEAIHNLCLILKIML
jgi:hypothetical protein